MKYENTDEIVNKLVRVMMQNSNNRSWIDVLQFWRTIFCVQNGNSIRIC